MPQFLIVQSTKRPRSGSVERFERFRFSVPAVPLQKGVFLCFSTVAQDRTVPVSVPGKRFRRFRFRFRFRTKRFRQFRFLVPVRFLVSIESINCNYMNNLLENYFCCQATITITRLAPLRIIYLIISWTMAFQVKPGLPEQAPNQFAIYLGRAPPPLELIFAGGRPIKKGYRGQELFQVIAGMPERLGKQFLVNLFPH